MQGPEQMKIMVMGVVGNVLQGKPVFNIPLKLDLTSVSSHNGVEGLGLPYWLQQGKEPNKYVESNGFQTLE